MMWEVTPFTILLAVTASTLIITAFYIWVSSHVPGAKTVSLLILVGTTWALAYTAELSSPNMSSKIFWDKVQFSAMVMVPPLWITYVLQFTGLEKWLTRGSVALLGTVPALLLFLVFTNDSHSLLWSHVVLTTRGALTLLDKTYNTGYWFSLTYSYALIIFGSFLLVQVSIHSRHLYRQQGRTLLFAVFLPLLGCLIYVLGVTSFLQFSSPLLLTVVTALVVAWGLVRLRLANIVPVAWESAIHSMTDSVIVLDDQNCITNLNPAAQVLLGRPTAQLIGHPIEEVWVSSPDFAKDHLRRGGEVAKEVVMKVGKIQHTYDMRISPLVDWRGRTISQVVVLRDISERKHAEKLLHESEEKFRTIFENASDEIVYMDKHGNVTDINRKTEGMFGYKPEDLIGRNFTELGFIGLDMTEIAGLFKNGVIHKGPAPATLMELELRDRTGKKVFAEVSIKMIEKDGEVESILAIVRDITERKQAEDRIKASLKEKEILLREIHHRVKNNLQVISSLLSLQSTCIRDSQLKEMIRESQDRIRSMALIHEKLYNSRNLADIDLEEYVEGLVHGLMRSYGADSGVIDLKIEVGDVSLGVDTAIPCGLIINELVSNCLKHAFSDGRRGVITVALHSVDGSTELMVRDNGVGMPETVDFRNTESLGLRLVTILAEDQLKGKIALEREGGTTFRITFGEKS